MHVLPTLIRPDQSVLVSIVGGVAGVGNCDVQTRQRTATKPDNVHCTGLFLVGSILFIVLLLFCRLYIKHITDD